LVEPVPVEKGGGMLRCTFVVLALALRPAEPRAIGLGLLFCLFARNALLDLPQVDQVAHDASIISGILNEKRELRAWFILLGSRWSQSRDLARGSPARTQRR